MAEIKYTRDPLQHFLIEQRQNPLAFPPSTFAVAHIAAQVVDATDTAIVNAIIAAAREAGITDLYLIDKEFIVEAIREGIDRKNKRAVTVEQYNDLREAFVDFVCSGIHNPAPYCKNSRKECTDRVGWCANGCDACRGFNPDGRADHG